METIINVKVFEPSWLEMTKEDQDYFRQLKEPDDLAIMKYRETQSFDFGYDIVKHFIDRQRSCPITIRYEDSKNNEPVEKEITLTDILAVTFEGEHNSGKLIISSSLIESEFSASKSSGKQYCYTYLNGNRSYFRVAPNIWLSETTMNMLTKKYQNLQFQLTPDLNVRDYTFKI